MKTKSKGEVTDFLDILYKLGIRFNMSLTGFRSYVVKMNTRRRLY
jgi:hypothetical protein